MKGHRNVRKNVENGLQVEIWTKVSSRMVEGRWNNEDKSKGEGFVSKINGDNELSWLKSKIEKSWKVA